MRRFGFTDSSGILKSDRFFGTGLLVVRNVGDMIDKLHKNSQPVRQLVTASKNVRIDALIKAGKKDEVIKMLRSNYRFEMKFDNVRPSTLDYYETMMNIFLADPENRFSVMVVDKQNPAFSHKGAEDSWEAYTKYVALLVVKEMKSMPSDHLCLIVDEITKPRSKPLSLEGTLMGKIREESAKEEVVVFGNVFGALSIESHSNLPMQLCDVLLGAVMYDYKKQAGLTSENTEKKKEALVSKIRGVLGVDTLTGEAIESSKASFSVLEYT